MSEPAAGTKDAPAPPAKKKKKEKKFDPLSDEPIKFKVIDFEHALTPEEKAAIKAEKLGAKKGDKKKKKKGGGEEKAEASPPVEPEPPKKKKAKKAEEASVKTKQAEATEGKKKEKKGKGEGTLEVAEGADKGKKGKAKKEEAAPAEAGAAEDGKDKRKGKKDKEEQVEAAEDRKHKNKGKKEEGKQTATESTEEDKKDKKGKGKKEKGESVESEGQEQTNKKGKKGKGKGKEKKEAMVEQEETLKPLHSVSAFLERYASQHRLEDSDDWTWESYSQSVHSEVPEPEPEPEEKGKRGKGKGKEKKVKTKKEEGAEAEVIQKGRGKGKKGKGKEEAPPPPPEVVESVVDIMAEINRMKALAEAQAQGVEEAPPEEEPPKRSKKGKKEKGGEDRAKEKPKGKGPKTKLTKEENEKLATKLTEQARIQAELDAKQAEEEERIRKIEEKNSGIAKEKRETAEQQLRTEQLNNSINFFQFLKKYNVEKALHTLQNDQWEQFLKCGGLLNPYVCGEMNTYLHLWETVLDTTTFEEAAKRTVEVLYLLDQLTSLIDDPAGATKQQIDNWKWLHCLFREYQQRSLDSATYRLLRDINKKLRAVDLLTADFQRKEESFTFSLWVLIRLPTSKPNPKKPPPPRIEIDFPYLRMSVLFPVSIKCYCMAVRALYVKYDHLSSLCETYNPPAIPEAYDVDLYKATLEEWHFRLMYKFEEDRKEKRRVRIEAGLRPVDKNEIPPVVDRAAGIIPIVPFRILEPSASEHVIAQEDTLYMEERSKLITTVNENIINLRKYFILGGTYSLDLYYQPPQPKLLISMDVTVTRLEIPKCLREVRFHACYQAPSSTDPAAQRDPKELEEEMDELIFVKLMLPSHIIWLDEPLICHWDRKRKVWTTQDIHDLKFFEDEGYMTFRTSRFGCFSFAANRYQNLPFQAWEMTPQEDGSVTLQISAALFIVEFNIKNNLVCLLQLKNILSNVKYSLQEIIGIYYKLPTLIRIIREDGLDFFPAFDAFCYVEGACEKHWPMEKHLYHHMALLSVGFTFRWSRWNMTAGRRSVIMQMREYKPEKIRQAPFSMLQVTPLKAQFIDCTEHNLTFSEEPIPGMLFYSDLFHLMKGMYGMDTRTKVQNANLELVGTVVELLLNTRILSFS